MTKHCLHNPYWERFHIFTDHPKGTDHQHQRGPSEPVTYRFTAGSLLCSHTREVRAWTPLHVAMRVFVSALFLACIAIRYQGNCAGLQKQRFENFKIIVDKMGAIILQRVRTEVHDISEDALRWMRHHLEFNATLWIPLNCAQVMPALQW